MNSGKDQIPPGYHERELTIGDIQRKYLVYAPEKLADKKSWPVVLAFHGGGVNAASMVEFSGLSGKADEAGFLAVYPSGSGRVERFLTWNAGNCCGFARKYNIDDVGFIDALLDDLPTFAPIDPRRVYATGMSNGGVMSYQLANKLAHRIAAIAPVAGVTGTESVSPSRPVPVCHFHGTGDEYVNWEGGVGVKSLSRTDFLSVDYTIDLWKRANGGEERPEVESIYDGREDGMPIEKLTYAGEAPVVVYKIKHGGHTWPGRIPQLEKLGRSTTKISANDIIWDFFQQFALD